MEQFPFLSDLTQFSCIDRIVLFGSRARKTNLERSDIDIAIECPNASLKDWNDIIETVEGADTLLKIDCIRSDNLSKSNSLKQRILDEGETLFDRGIS